MFKPRKFRPRYFGEKYLSHLPFHIKLKSEFKIFRWYVRDEFRRLVDETGNGVNGIIATVMRHDVQWTYAFGFEDYADAEFQTANEAHRAADDAYADWCNDNVEGARSGDWQEEQGELIKFFWDENTGERRVIQRQMVTVEWENYHGDYAEHNTHWGL